MTAAVFFARRAAASRDETGVSSRAAAPREIFQIGGSVARVCGVWVVVSTVALYLRKNRAYVFNYTTLRLTSTPHTRRRRRSTHTKLHCVRTQTSDHTRDAHPRHTTQWNRTHETRHTVTM